MKRKLLKISAGLVLAVILAATGYLIYYYVKYPNVSEAPDVKIQATAEMIERGKYLSTHVYVCFECHTPRNWDYFAGPLIEEQQGMGGELMNPQYHKGEFHTSNITPAYLGDWTDGEIMRAINVGADNKGEPLYWGMPSYKYSKMPEEDIKAIVAYLRTLKPIHNEVPEPDPDWSIWKDMRTWQEDAKPQPAPDKSNTLKYGEYMAEMASCTGCHTHFDKEGVARPELGLSGGFAFTLPGRKDTVRSSNITPDTTTGIGLWSKEIFIARFKMYATAEGKKIPARPGQFQSPMHWTMYAGMTEEDLGAIYEYLMSQKPVKNRVIRFTPFTEEK